MFIDSAKFYSKFSDKTLFDSITSNVFTVVGDDQNLDILDGGLGYVMKHDQNLELNNFTFSISTDFSLGFWLYPVNQGQVLHPDTGEISNVIMPLISFFSGDNPVIELNEISKADGTNYLSVKINDTYTVTTESYVTEVFHFIYVAWAGEIGKVSVFVDGREQKTTNSGSVQLSLSGSTLDIFINKFNELGFNVAQNTGYIDDIVVFNDSKDAAKRTSNAINFSVDFIVDTLLVNKDEFGQAFLFNDPPTVRTTAMVDDLSFIYLSRDDGKILRGSPLFWEVRKVFSENNEEDLIEETVLDIGGAVNASLDGGFLKIKSSIVRL